MLSYGEFPDTLSLRLPAPPGCFFTSPSPDKAYISSHAVASTFIFIFLPPQRSWDYCLLSSTHSSHTTSRPSILLGSDQGRRSALLGAILRALSTVSCLELSTDIEIFTFASPYLFQHQSVQTAEVDATDIGTSSCLGSYRQEESQNAIWQRLPATTTNRQHELGAFPVPAAIHPW